MKITRDTKISKILKENKRAIEVIAGINKHFKKLNNPVLRNVLAPRVSVSDAAKIGNVSINDILKRLEHIGFEVDYEKESASEITTTTTETKDLNTIRLDVRPIIETGADPFKDIMHKLKEINEDEILEVINVFEPIPLIKIMKEKGYEVWSEKVEENEFHTFFKKNPHTSDDNVTEDIPISSGSFEEKLASHGSNLREIDVRLLEMPEPMVTILKEVESLPEGYILLVNHKKVPQFLLPELKKRDYTWMHKEIDAGLTQLLIFKEKNL